MWVWASPRRFPFWVFLLRPRPRTPLAQSPSYSRSPQEGHRTDTCLSPSSSPAQEASDLRGGGADISVSSVMGQRAALHQQIHKHSDVKAQVKWNACHKKKLYCRGVLFCRSKYFDIQEVCVCCMRSVSLQHSLKISKCCVLCVVLANLGEYIVHGQFSISMILCGLWCNNVAWNG